MEARLGQSRKDRDLPPPAFIADADVGAVGALGVDPSDEFGLGRQRVEIQMLEAEPRHFLHQRLEKRGQPQGVRVAVAGRDESEIEVPVLQPVPKRLKNVEQNEKAIQILLPGPVTGGEILGSGDQHKAASAGVVVQAKIPVEQSLQRREPKLRRWSRGSRGGERRLFPENGAALEPRGLGRPRRILLVLRLVL